MYKQTQPNEPIASHYVDSFSISASPSIGSTIIVSSMSSRPCRARGWPGW